MCVTDKEIPSQHYLTEALTYCPDTGLLWWKHRPVAHFSCEIEARRWNARWAGKPAFRTTTGGYKAGKISGTSYFAHRVIWKMVHGIEPEVIDHWNHDRSDNRIANLRNGTQSENVRNAPRRIGTPRWPNRKTYKRNIVRTRHGWSPRINVHGVRHCLGFTPCFGVAVKLRLDAEARDARS